MSGLPFRSLTGDRAFRRLRRGRSGGAKQLGIRWRATHDGVVRVGIVVSRKVGKAVVRNRVRRRLREAFLSLLRETPFKATSFDLIVLTRPEAAAADYHTLKAALERALRRGGLL